MDYEFVVAGGGIGGTVLAHLLARGGKKVLVVEKSLGPPIFVRPEGLWPATATLLRSLLPQKEIGQAWIPLQGLRAFEGERELLRITPEIFARAGVQLSMTDPNQTREQLLRLETFELRRGVEVIGVLKDGNRVTGVRTREASGKEQNVTAEWTVGDDGVHSRIREACGIELKTRLFPIDFMAFGFAWPSSLPTAVAHVWLNKKRTRTGIVGLAAGPMPNGRGAALLPVRPSAFDALAKKEEAWAEFRERDSRLADVAGAIKFPKEVARIKRPWGHATRYGAAGAVLLGDAAHPVSPAAGQGANMAVADAVVLAEVFLSGRKDIVAEYERRRRAANERSISFTRRGAQFLGLPAFLGDALLPYGMRWVNRRPEMIERGLRSAGSAFLEQ